MILSRLDSKVIITPIICIQSQILKHIQKRNHFDKLDIAHTSNNRFTIMLSQIKFLDRPYDLFKPVNFFS